MNLTRVGICVILMALVTYIPRVLPVTIFRKEIKSRFIRSFLDYTPYAVLGALTFPDVFFSTGHFYSAAGGTLVAVILGYRGKSLVVLLWPRLFRFTCWNWQGEFWLQNG